MFLTEVELQMLTGRKRGRAQARALVRMGIEHHVNLRGDVVVSRRRIEETLGCALQTATKAALAEPNWKALANA
jgi:hypothetical protein